MYTQKLVLYKYMNIYSNIQNSHKQNVYQLLNENVVHP